MKRLKILTHRAHCGHQYELWKLPHDFTCVTGLNQTSDNWNYYMRPLRPNVTFKHKNDINLKDYDIAILHFDEFAMDTPNHPLLIGWGNAFEWFMDKANLPRVLICHGTPQFKERADMSFNNYTKQVTIEDDKRLRLVERLKNNLIICNSHQAKKEWGFAKSKVIWHGFDPEEFKESAYNNKNVLSPLEGALTQRPHYRGYFLFKEIKKYLDTAITIGSTLVPDPQIDIKKFPNAFAKLKLGSYINFIRGHSIYLNTTVLSPMPRCRGEALMCGLVTVNAANHDIDMFIENGKNGFYSNDAKELADILMFLIKNPLKLKEIGKRGRATAIKLFHIDRYLFDWQDTLKLL